MQDSNDLERLIEELIDYRRMIRNVGKIFKELDSDESGRLEKDEITSLAKWVLMSSTLKPGYKPSESEILAVKEKLLTRFNTTSDGGITIQDVAILQDDILVCLLLIALLIFKAFTGKNKAAEKRVAI